jgi:O-6-methylguanine DNA methyltransferase
MVEKAEVLKKLLKIPRGKVTTYKELAKACKTHPRAIARILSSNNEPDKFPCFKVVNSDGGIGGYTHELGVTEKIRRLKKEGVIIRKGRINFTRYLYNF